MSDPGHRVPDPPRYEFVMPAVRDVRIEAAKMEGPRLRNFRSSLPVGIDTFAIVVTTEGPIPTRAEGPALFIGDAMVAEVTEVGPNTYRFVAHAPAELKRGAPIRLGWTGEGPADRDPVRFHFDP
jgi:hypothetical protein